MQYTVKYEQLFVIFNTAERRLRVRSLSKEINIVCIQGKNWPALATNKL